MHQLFAKLCLEQQFDSSAYGYAIHNYTFKELLLVILYQSPLGNSCGQELRKPPVLGFVEDFPNNRVMVVPKLSPAPKH